MKELLEKYLARIDKLGGNSRQLIFEKPATELDISDIENKLTYKIPIDFRNVLLTVSSHCEFIWFLPNDFALPDPLREIFRGELHWGLEFIQQFNESKDEWITEVFPNADDKYDKVWHNKFVFQEVGNGDYISIDLAPGNYGKIVYLSHDDGEGHGFIMANSFYDLLRNWTKLGCVGGEDWQWLPFCKNNTSGIDPDCDNAQLWCKTIGLI
ncbi:SMI1/KNR4 family protein [Danxiaibacter flavus]|uniref:SMI1/KNR4 family protein n=1 Tax=Danxiaibacter flavus TaxID=3049108 RepID=A0ABV3ZL10_9BACT|nr:SMI1/KNR4 family protein [Chitinophagaceae bacterium DXS]